uniref:Acid phosphatase n=1 Tax=Strongyloides papillosus TaxID=174720 RepID=A0A0N5B6C5_STREA
MILATLLLPLFYLSTTNGDDTLLGVQVLWRHGARPPEVIFDYDPHKNDWPVPLGELTPLGMRQHYDLGKRLMQRYGEEYKLINTSYNVGEIYVRSTDVNRALASAYSNLAGMFSESKNTYPDSNWPSQWTPIPVHTVPDTDDNLLNPTFYCPRLYQLSDERLQTKQFLIFENTFSSLFDYLTLHSGANITDYKSLETLYVTIRVEKYFNYSQPSWVTDDIFKQMESFVNSSINYSYGCAGFGLPEDTELISLKGGHLVWQMIDNMKTIKNNGKIEKYIAYSAHHTTLISFANVLGAKVKIMGQGLIDFAASFILELWKDENGNYYIKLFYANNAYGDFTPVTHLIRGCINQDKCSLDDFENGASAYLQHYPQDHCTAV